MKFDRRVIFLLVILTLFAAILSCGPNANQTGGEAEVPDEVLPTDKVSAIFPEESLTIDEPVSINTKAVIDTGDTVGESNEGNNTFLRNIKVNP